MLAALSLACSASAGDGRKPKAEPFALVAGTVFRDIGFALPGATVVLDPQPGEDRKGVKVKRAEAVTDGRGEFAFRVPPAPVRYTVVVKAKGFKSDRKEVAIQGEERVDLFFRLEPESK